MMVKAKRLGWDEVLTPVQEFDLDPYDREDDDLVGELLLREIPATEDHGAFTFCLVGGQEADPRTVTQLEQ